MKNGFPILIDSMTMDLKFIKPGKYDASAINNEMFLLQKTRKKIKIGNILYIFGNGGQC